MKFFHSLKAKLASGPYHDEPLEQQQRDLSCMESFRLGLAKVQPDCDFLPNAYGDFGTSLTNPIPVNGPIGEIVYLNQLRWQNKVGFFYHRLGSLDTPVSEMKIDAFELVTIDSSYWTVLYFVMYHPRRSRKAPLNMTLMDWSKMEVPIKMGIKYPVFGSTSFVETFPFRLSEAVASNDDLKSLMPDAAATFARRIDSMVLENGTNWVRPDAHKQLVNSIRPESPRAISLPTQDTSSPKGQISFGEDGRATIVAGEGANGSALMYMLGAMLRRDLSPPDQIIAGRWVGAILGDDGEPIWNEPAEQQFASAYVRYIETRTKSDAMKDILNDAQADGTVPLSPEMIDMFERYTPPGSW